MKSAVLDSFAVISYLFQEKGHEKIVSLFDKAAEADVKILISASNWAEVRYIIERRAGVDRWTDIRGKLLGLPLEIVPEDQGLAESAGEIKIPGKMSLADCFAAALARQRGLDLYTGDPEFKAVEHDQKIHWL